MKYYIKERHNPQLGVYFTGLGRLSKKEAKEHGRSLYGQNIIHSYDTLEEYSKALDDLRNSHKLMG